MKKTIYLLTIILLIATYILCGCTGQGESKTEHSFVRLTLEEGEFIIELYPEIAPKSVALFLHCVESGYYNDKVFHRTIPGLIQGGSADGFGVGGCGKTVEGEFTENGFTNDLKHERGVISMARTSDPNSASGQFFIMTDTQSYLDGKYATFGKVVEGIELADKIAAMPTRGFNMDELTTKPVIQKAEVLQDYTPSGV
ncbi:MAG: peptidylprolyl isomerase [Ruminococcaceae bacterium]|nr:peptidylprolyl isomerase [Oscillospiraceae bacterium]